MAYQSSSLAAECHGSSLLSLENDCHYQETRNDSSCGSRSRIRQSCSVQNHHTLRGYVCMELPAKVDNAESHYYDYWNQPFETQKIGCFWLHSKIIDRHLSLCQLLFFDIPSHKTPAWKQVWSALLAVCEEQLVRFASSPLHCTSFKKRDTFPGPNCIA